MYDCDTYWGSHGCSLEKDHEGPCMCITNFYNEDGEVVESYCEGNCAPPYFGEHTHFFSNHGSPIPPQTIAAARQEPYEEASEDDIREGIRLAEERLGTTFAQWKEFAAADDFPNVATKIVWYAYGSFENLL